MHLTARGYQRVLRVARTLADLAGAEKVGWLKRCRIAHWPRICGGRRSHEHP
jgi:hypothetical protein